MVVGVDEAGHDDHVAGVDGLGAIRDQIGSDRLDATVANVHVGARQHPERRINRDHRAVLDQIIAAGHGRRGTLRESLTHQARRCKRAHSGCAQQMREFSTIEHCGLPVWLNDRSRLAWIRCHTTMLLLR